MKRYRLVQGKMREHPHGEYVMADYFPMFADDVVAHPGARGWFPGIDESGTVGETGLNCGNGEWGAGIEECYSTRAAAEAAEGIKA